MQLIVLTAGRARRLWPLTLTWPKALLSVGGQPAVFHLLTPLLSRGFRDVTLVAAPAQRAALETVVAGTLAGSGATVRCVEQDVPRGPGDALARVASLLTGPVLVLLGDTLCRVPEDFRDDWIGVSPYPPGTHASWCTVATDPTGTVTELLDKPASADAPDRAAIGMYFFRDPDLLRDALARAMAEGPGLGGEFQLKPILDHYRARRPLRALELDGWVDLGTLRGYRQAVRSSLPGRHFNALTVDRTGRVRKQTLRVDGEENDEAGWFTAVPPGARLLAPRFLGADDDGKGYATEYLDYLTLAEFFTFGYVPAQTWPEILGDLIEVLDTQLWARHHDPANRDWARAMYLEKTLARLAGWHRQDLLARDGYVINGVPTPGFAALWRAARPLVDDLVRTSPPYASVVHGDLSFGNILYAPRSGIFRLVDPRGGPPGRLPVGDLRYEGAKLRQCYHGRYCHVVADLFRLAERAPGEFDLTVYGAGLPDPADLDARLARYGFDIRQLELIEALLFLSMLPLHEDSPRRQLAFFVTALRSLHRLVRDRVDDRPAVRDAA